MLLAISLLVQSVPFAGADETAAPFPDMERSWYRYREAAEFLQARGVLQGYPDGNFHPKDGINRAEFLKIVFRGRSSNDPVGGGCFSDVPEDAWFAPYVCAAARRNIVKGYPDGTFKPDQTVNTAEAIKMIFLAYGKEIQEREGENWYEPYAAAIDRLGVLSRSSYIPWDTLTRERAADLIARFLRHEEDNVIANLSPGCGKDSRSDPTGVTVGGVEREFLLTKPRRYISHDPHPLIIAFHGRTNANDQVRSYFKLDREATDYFIAYPAALKKDNGTFAWSDPSDKLSTLRDVAFFDAIVQELGETYCIDFDRIFTVGHSLGAWMANSVACARGDVIRGSATVGGSSMIAPCAGPSAALVINNPKDTLSPHYAAEATRDLRIESNHCGDKTKEVAPSSLKCVEYQSCEGPNPVVWCPHEIDRDDYVGYYPHLWPDETAETIVTFFDGLK